MTALTSWIPKYLLESPHAIGGQSVSASQWNELWLLNQLQGDDTTATLKQLIDALYASVLHPTEGAKFLTNLAITLGGSTTIAGQILELRDRIIASEDDIVELDARITNITVGVISAYQHNALIGRDLANAHSIAAITGLQSLLSAFESTLEDHAEVLETHNNALSDWRNLIPYAGATTNVGNDYAISLAIPELIEGMAVCVRINANATAACTLNWNFKGAKAIVKANGVPVTNLRANGIYTLRYYSPNFTLQGEGAGGNATAADLLSGKTASVDTEDIVGTMPDRGVVTITPDSTVATVLPNGHYDNGIIARAYPLNSAVPITALRERYPSVEHLDMDTSRDASYYYAFLGETDTNLYYVTNADYKYVTYMNKTTKVITTTTTHLDSSVCYTYVTSAALYVLTQGYSYKISLTGALIWRCACGAGPTATGIIGPASDEGAFVIWETAGTPYIQKSRISSTGVLLSTDTLNVGVSATIALAKHSGAYLYCVIGYPNKLLQFETTTGTLVSTISLPSGYISDIDPINQRVYISDTTTVTAKTYTGVTLWAYAHLSTGINKVIARKTGVTLLTADYRDIIKLSLDGTVEYKQKQLYSEINGGLTLTEFDRDNLVEFANYLTTWSLSRIVESYTITG